MTLRQPLFISRVAELILASSTFFVAVGPGVGALVFLPTLGPVAAVMAGYPFGVLPAVLAGALNACSPYGCAGSLPSFAYDGLTLLLVVCAEFLEPSLC